MLHEMTDFKITEKFRGTLYRTVLTCNEERWRAIRNFILFTKRVRHDGIYRLWQQQEVTID
jgi:hypothetical protein